MSKKLPSLPAVRTEDRGLNSWIQAVTEHLETRGGWRDPSEKSVVEGDLSEIRKVVGQLAASTRDKRPGDVPVQVGGLSASIAIDSMVDSLLGNSRFKKAIDSSASSGSVSTGSDGGDANRVSAELRASITALESRVADTSKAANDAASDARTARALVSKISGSNRGALLFCGDLLPGYNAVQVARWAMWWLLGSAPGVDISKDEHVVIGDTVVLRVLDSLGVPTGDTIGKRYIGGAWVDIGVFINGNSIADGTIPQKKMELAVAQRLAEILGLVAAGNGSNSGKPYLNTATLLGNTPGAFSVQTLLQDLYDRLIVGTKPNRMHDDTILFNGLTTRQLMEYIWARLPANPL